MEKNVETRPQPPVGGGLYLAKAPPFWLPMRHFVAAAAAFWLFAAAFVYGRGRFLGFDIQAQWILGLVHLATLGWVTMSMFGALCQLAPVLWEAPLRGQRVAGLAWWLFSFGVAGFVGLLWTGRADYWIPASMVVAAVLLYLGVFVWTMAAAPKLDWTGKHVANAVGYLAVVVTLGLLLAYDRERGVILSHPAGALIAHIHLALVGWVSLVIVGVSYRLVSMFALSHIESKTPGRLTLLLANVGLAGLAVDAFCTGGEHLRLWAVLLTAAYVSYLSHMRNILKARTRNVDVALAFTLLALLGGAVWCALGLGLAFHGLVDDTNVEQAYVFAALVGWVTPFIVGQMHKILPFLVWLHVYSPRGALPAAPLPKMADLTSRRVAWLEFAALVPAIYVTLAGFLRQSQALLTAGSLFLLAAATLYVANTAITLRHLPRGAS
ncbi:MAG: hypothetical protein KGL53_03505 [Elusimicrobia bacterium]|nr:hypothetical protein [Elusimicrobiota bacterium]